MLQNEHVRAVGNMKVNARGDKLDNANQVVETRSERIQRQNDSTSTNVSHAPVQTSSRRGRSNNPVPDTPTPPVVEEPVVDTPTVVEETVVDIPIVVAPAPVEPIMVAPQPVADPVPPVVTEQPSAPTPTIQAGGLAGAIARSREIKQDLDRTRRQKAQDSGVRKI
jgi:hypothetical protein